MSSHKHSDEKILINSTSNINYYLINKIVINNEVRKEKDIFSSKRVSKILRITLEIIGLIANIIALIQFFKLTF